MLKGGVEMHLPSIDKQKCGCSPTCRFTLHIGISSMHNILSRINNVSTFLSSCMMTLLVAIAISSFLLTANPKGELAISSVKVCVLFLQLLKSSRWIPVPSVSSHARRYPNRKQDLAVIHFNVTAGTLFFLVLIQIGKLCVKTWLRYFIGIPSNYSFILKQNMWTPKECVSLLLGIIALFTMSIRWRMRL